MISGKEYVRNYGGSSSRQYNFEVKVLINAYIK
jgi:hypothetical protein